MLSIRLYLIVGLLSLFGFLNSCNSGSQEVVVTPNSVVLVFENVFLGDSIVLRNEKTEKSQSFTQHLSDSGQIHSFSEIKYVISQIRLVTEDGEELPYFVNNLDSGAFLLNHADPKSMQVLLENIPNGRYKEIKMGLGIPFSLNELNEEKFPKFYELASAHEAEMHWEWGLGYRFAKIEGKYGENDKNFKVHVGSTWQGTKEDVSSYVQGVDAYKELILPLKQPIIIENNAAKVEILANFAYFLTGKSHAMVLDAYNALPAVHTSENMLPFLDNMGGNGTSDKNGIFFIKEVQNAAF